MPDDRTEPYILGRLTQRCTACKWQEENGRIERDSCPACGAPVDGERTLTFGGLTVCYEPHKNRFRLTAPFGGGTVEIAEADTPDTLRFMHRHFRRWHPQGKAGNP
jgi:hypothetical protein